MLCGEACAASRLVEPRTGKRIGMVGGTVPFSTTERYAGRVSGDVWAFDEDWTAKVVYQDVRTGRVVGRFERPQLCPPGPASCSARVLPIPTGIALLGEGLALGRVAVMDTRGKIVAQHRVPACAPP